MENIRQKLRQVAYEAWHITYIILQFSFEGDSSQTFQNGLKKKERKRKTCITFLRRVTLRILVSDDRTAKKIFLGKRNGIRQAGRPTLWWLGSTANGMQSTGVTRWSKIAEDISVTSIILKQALVKI
jgi:hypothetical protein